jgi:hypothetical protein
VGWQRGAGRTGAPRTVALVLVALFVVTACGDGGDEHHAGTDRTAGVYLAALRWAAASMAGAPTSAPSGSDGDGDGDGDGGGDGDRPVVYALALSGDAIPTAVQVVVVKQLRDDVVVRFADARTEALDGGEDTEPVRDDGLLVSLGPVPAEGDDVTLAAELYRDRDDDHAYQLTVKLTGETWEVAGATPR